MSSHHGVRSWRRGKEKSYPLDPAIHHFYEGFDPSLSTTWSCQTCQYDDDYDESKPLSTCAGCHCVKYCSRKCQEADWPLHKVACVEVKKTIKKVGVLENKLRNFPPSPIDPSNFFEPGLIGSFWSLFEPRDYCRELSHLSELYLERAWHNENKELWGKCLDLKLELLRLTLGDNQGVRFELPQVLLYLNRDDDCVNFIKWWWFNSAKFDSDMGEHGSWEKGFWPYEMGCTKYDDLLAPLAPGHRLTDEQLERYQKHANSNYVCLDFMLALSLIKMRIVAHHRLLLAKEMDKDSAAAVSFQGVISTQGDILHRYLTIIKRINKYCLPGILNPTILRNQGRPESASSGSSEEAMLSNERYIRHFYRVPGCLKILEDVLSDVPDDLDFSYNTSR